MSTQAGQTFGGLANILYAWLKHRQTYIRKADMFRQIEADSQAGRLANKQTYGVQSGASSFAC